MAVRPHFEKKEEYSHTTSDRAQTAAAAASDSRGRFEMVQQINVSKVGFAQWLF
jgi:hypothetical protein